MMRRGADPFVFLTFCLFVFLSFRPFNFSSFRTEILLGWMRWIGISAWKERKILFVRIFELTNKFQVGK